MYVSDGVNWRGNVSFKFNVLLDHSIFKLYLSVQDISLHFLMKQKYTCNITVLIFTNRMKFCDMLNKIRNWRFLISWNIPCLKATNHDFVFWNNEVKHVPDSPKRNVPLICCFMCMFCRSLFVLMPLFFWTLFCLSFFDLQILISPVVSSNSSYY
jgi:hypothetical protein